MFWAAPASEEAGRGPHHYRSLHGSPISGLLHHLKQSLKPLPTVLWGRAQPVPGCAQCALTIALCDPEHPAVLSIPYTRPACTSTRPACASLHLLSSQDGVQGQLRRWYAHPGLQKKCVSHIQSNRGHSSRDSPTDTCPTTPALGTSTPALGTSAQVTAAQARPAPHHYSNGCA